MRDPEKAAIATHASSARSLHQPEDSDIVNETRSPPDLSARSANNELNQPVEIQSPFYLKGWKLQGLNFALGLSLFLSTLESTIVSTSLVAITNSLDGFQKSSWIVTAYLLTYTEFLTIVAKLSDIHGRKTLLVGCLALFVVFSMACGAVHRLRDLIVLRAFQGIGGGGIYTMVFVILPEMVSPQQYPTYAAFLSSVFALSNLMGPILGGLISSHTTWRWVFFLNGPAGAVALILILICLPSNFPHPPGFVDETALIDKHKVKRLDLIGFFLLLAASILFVTAIEEGGTEYPWNSAVVISLLVPSLFLWPALLLWSRPQERRTTWQEPVLPWRLISNRFSMAPLLNSFFAGAAFISLVITLPQKFQVVYGSSPFDAGYKLLTLTICTPVGSALAGLFTQKLKTPPLYILLAGGVVQVVGMALMISLHEVPSAPFPPAEYGYEVVMGVGFGLSLGTVVMMSPLVFEKRDMAVGIGAIGQFRVLGGSIGLAVCTNIVNSHVASDLRNVLSPAELQSLQSSMQSLSLMSTAVQERVREAYLGGFQMQMQALVAFGGGAILVSLLMIEKKPRWQKS